MPFAPRVLTPDKILPGYPGEIASLDNYPNNMSSWTNIQQAAEIIPFGRFVQLNEAATDAKCVQLWAGVKPVIGVALCPLDFVTTDLTLPGASQYPIGEEVLIGDAIDCWVQVKASVVTLAKYTQIRVDVADATYKACITDAVAAAGTVIELPGCLVDSPVIDLGGNIKIVRVLFRNRLM
jgi:hypothetical protein